MGQTLSEPVTTKDSSSCANRNFVVGSSCMQGWRINMEDAHTHLLSLPDDPETAFFAVYDGHGGARVSQYAGCHLHKCIAQQPAFAEGRIDEAIEKGFLEIDEKMKADEEMRDDMSGTTAIVVMVKNEVIYCGNVGDSRAVVSVTGTAVPLSYDHKPANEEEARRIVAAGGWVEFNRVNGNLALSRALGDFAFKRNTRKTAEEQMVTAWPDVIREELTPNHEFILLACDGIWDVMSNQEVVDFCRDRLAAGRPPQSICEDLLSRCLAPDCQMGGLGCDNMTAVLIALTMGDSAETFKAKCERPRGELDDEKRFPQPLRTPRMSGGEEMEQREGLDAEMYHTPQPSPGIAVPGITVSPEGSTRDSQRSNDGTPPSSQSSEASHDVSSSPRASQSKNTPLSSQKEPDSDDEKPPTEFHT